MIKEIKLKPVISFYNYAKIAVIDFPDGDGPQGRERVRCQINVEFAEADVARIMTEATDFDGCMEHYKRWLYEVVKVNLAMDWECIAGWEDVMKIIEDHVAAYVNK